MFFVITGRPVGISGRLLCEGHLAPEHISIYSESEMPRLKWTRDRIILEIQRLHRRGERLSARRMRAIGLGGMVTTAYKLFGTWQAALDEAGDGFEVSPRQTWNQARIVQEIKGLALQGQNMSMTVVRNSNPALVNAVYRDPEIKNWTTALEMAGIDIEARDLKRRCWSRQLIVNAIHELAQKGINLGFSQAHQAYPQLVSAAARPQHFGSWAQAVQAAGFDYETFRQRQRWTRERVIATIKHLNARELPLTSSWLQRHGWASLVAVARRKGMFGSWRDAIECAGIDYEQARRDSIVRRQAQKLK